LSNAVVAHEFSPTPHSEEGLHIADQAQDPEKRLHDRVVPGRKAEGSCDAASSMTPRHLTGGATPHDLLDGHGGAGIGTGEEEGDVTGAGEVVVWSQNQVLSSRQHTSNLKGSSPAFSHNPRDSSLKSGSMMRAATTAAMTVAPPRASADAAPCTRAPDRRRRWTGVRR